MNQSLFAAGKSIADSRNKFYALRDMFEREQRVDKAQGEPQPISSLGHVLSEALCCN